MAEHRANTHVVEVDVEVAWAVLNGDFTTESLQLHAFDVTPTTESPEKENPANRQDLGEHAPTVGYNYEVNELKASVTMQGLGGIGAPVLQAVATAQAIALGGVFGVDPQASARNSTGSTVKAASTPTVDSIEETDAANHAVNQIVPFLSDSDDKWRARPVVTYASDVMTLAMNLPAGELPIVGAVIPGATNLEWYDGAIAAALASIQAESIGQDEDDNSRFLGMNGDLSIPEVGPNEVPKFDLTFRAGFGQDLFSRAQVKEIVTLPYVAAGGEFLIAPFGSKVFTALPTNRIGIEFGATYEPLEDFLDEIKGIDGWWRPDVKTRISLTLPQEMASPAGSTSGATTYKECWRNRKIVETPDRWHLLFSWGQGQIGRSFTLYFGDVMQIEKPSSTENINGRRANKMMFAPLANSTSTMPRVMGAFW